MMANQSGTLANKVATDINRYRFPQARFVTALAQVTVSDGGWVIAVVSSRDSSWLRMDSALANQAYDAQRPMKIKTLFTSGPEFELHFRPLLTVIIASLAFHLHQFPPHQLSRVILAQGLVQFRHSLREKLIHTPNLRGQFFF